MVPKLQGDSHGHGEFEEQAGHGAPHGDGGGLPSLLVSGRAGPRPAAGFGDRPGFLGHTGGGVPGRSGPASGSERLVSSSRRRLVGRPDRRRPSALPLSSLVVRSASPLPQYPPRRQDSTKRPHLHLSYP